MSAAENTPCVLCEKPFKPREPRVIVNDRDNDTGRTTVLGRIHRRCWRRVVAGWPVLQEAAES